VDAAGVPSIARMVTVAVAVSIFVNER